MSAEQVELEVEDESISLDMEDIEQICWRGEARTPASEEHLTLPFVGCSKRRVKLMALHDTRRARCGVPPNSLVLTLEQVSGDCDATFQLDGATRSQSQPARERLDIVVKAGAGVLERLELHQVAAYQASNEASAGDILSSAKGKKLEISATSMRLASLGVGTDRRLHVDFADADMGYAWRAEANDDHRLAWWRLERFGTALIGAAFSFLVKFADFVGKFRTSHSRRKLSADRLKAKQPATGAVRT